MTQSPPVGSSTSPPPMPTSLSPQEAERLLKEVDYVLFDVDGVIWSGDHVYYQVPETLYWLAKKMQKKVRFMTNNATRTRVATKDEFVEKGMTFVTDDMVYSSAFVAALELKNRWAVRREAETTEALNNVPNPFNESESASASDKLDASVFARQQSIARLESDRFPHNVFVIGEKGLHDELREVALAPDATTVGFELVIDPRSDNKLLRAVNYPTILTAVNEPVIPVGVRTLGAVDRFESISSLNCGAVVVGLDRNFNMLKMAIASLVLQRPSRDKSALKVDFIATNEDPSITIGEEGYHFPGAGSCLEMLKKATGLVPDCVCGKPEQLMAKVFLQNEGVKDPSRCLMVGDRISTDIAFGRGMGARTLMVLTGAESMADIEAAPASLRPEFIAPSAASLMYTSMD